MTKSVIANIRLTPRDKKAAEIAAKLSGQTLSSLINHALTVHVRRKYPLVYRHGETMQLSKDEI